MPDVGTRWSTLTAEPLIVEALDHAGQRPGPDASQNEKRAWSERFANGCAIAISTAIRQADLPAIRGREVKPESLAGGTEPVAPLGSDSQKRIDVQVVDSVLGLEIGISLKGLNFQDQRSKNYDKNLTGRLYEMNDEMRLVHENLPHCFMIGIFFLPVAATGDKLTGNTSFANTVIKLRGRTGRLDPALGAHSSKCDSAYVGLYSLGSPEDNFTRGAARFTNVLTDPPRRGRPRIADTLSLAEMVVEFVGQAAGDVASGSWGEAEED